MVSTNLRKEKKYKLVKDFDLTNKNTISSDEEATILKSKNELNTDTQTTKQYKIKYVWTNILAFVMMHICSVIGLNHFLRLESYKVIYIQLLFSFITNIGVTAGAHRLWAHRGYKAKRPLELILAVLFVCAGQNDIYEWVRDHRVHHKFSETDADPHNSKRGFFFAHMGWLCCKKHPEVIRKGRTIDMSDLENDPMVKFQRKYYKLLHPLTVILLPAYLVMRYTGLNLYWAIISSITRYQVVLHFTWLVNSAAHLWGSHPYNDKISPAESPVAIIGTFAYGEGYHNYHHTYPWDYRCSEFGWSKQANITALFIDICAYFGWAYDLRTTNQKLIDRMKENVIKRKNSKEIEEDQEIEYETLGY